MDEPEAATPLVAGQRLRGASRAHVLVAEDNPADRNVAVKLLERLGYRADEVGNGLEAVESLGRIRYAAVLMDCQMPGMDGYGAAREIRRRESLGSRPRHTPIIAMTGAATGDDVDRCREAGMDDVVPKPIGIDHLAAVLERWLPHAAPPGARTGVAPGDAGDQEPPAPAAGPGGAPVDAVPLEPALDPARLEVLRRMAGGADLLGEVVTMFLQEAPGRFAALAAAVEGDDASALAFAAHRLKGGAATVGATRLARLCEALEAQGRDGSCAGAAAALPAVRRELERTRVALADVASP